METTRAAVPTLLKWSFYPVNPRPGAPTVNSYEGASIRLRVAGQGGVFGPPREVGYVGAMFKVDRTDPFAARPKFAGYGFWIRGANQYGIPNRGVREDVPLATLDAAKEEATTYMNRYLLYPEPAPETQP
jgi:hypothetical protein